MKTWYYCIGYSTEVEGPIRANNEKEARKILRKKRNKAREERDYYWEEKQLPRNTLFFPLVCDLTDKYWLLENKHGVKKKKEQGKTITIDDLY